MSFYGPLKRNISAFEGIGIQARLGTFGIDIWKGIVILESLDSNHS
jgi:hypothetical protein